MAKTPEKKRDIMEDKYCQDCKFQSNKPSYCREHGRYTGRKQTCDSWRLKK